MPLSLFASGANRSSAPYIFASGANRPLRAVWVYRNGANRRVYNATPLTLTSAANFTSTYTATTFFGYRVSVAGILSPNNLIDQGTHGVAELGASLGSRILALNGFSGVNPGQSFLNLLLLNGEVLTGADASVYTFFAPNVAVWRWTKSGQPLTTGTNNIIIATNL